MRLANTATEESTCVAPTNVSASEELMSNSIFSRTRVLRGGMSGAATGVMMFTAHAVASDDGKMRVTRELYREGK